MAIKKYYINTEKEGYIYDRNAKKYYSYGYNIWLGAVREEQRGFATKDLAMAAAANRKADYKAKQNGLPVKSDLPYLIELFQKKLDTLRPGRERTLCKRIFKYFLDLLPPGIKVIELRKAHLNDFVTARKNDIAHRSGRPVTPQSAKRELVPIIATLASAGDFFPELEDWSPPKTPQVKTEKTGRERVFQSHELEKIFGYLFSPRKKGEYLSKYRGRLRTGYFLQFCLLTLARPGEAAGLRFEHIKADHIEIHGTKTRYKSRRIIRQVPLSPELQELIARQIANSEGFYTTHIFTKSGVVAPAMYEQMAEACSFAGVPYGDGKNELSFHSARHTGITMLLLEGVDLKTIGAISGQSDAKMTLYYTHTNKKAVSEAAGKLVQKMTFLKQDREYLEGKPKL